MKRTGHQERSHGRADEDPDPVEVPVREVVVWVCRGSGGALLLRRALQLHQRLPLRRWLPLRRQLG
jgi:hypothetical protein